ncbi:MAG: DUF4173 domain-containing protein [Bacteroidota bacterium]
MNRGIVLFGIALAAHLLIWESSLGWNAMIFCLMVTAGMNWLKPEVFARTEVKALLGAWCYSALCVVLHHSDLSIVVYWLTAMVCIGYMQAERVHFWGFGLVESARALFGGWFIALRGQMRELLQASDLWQPIRQLRLLLVPLAITAPFLVLYSSGNASFDSLGEWLGDRLSGLFALDIDWGRFIVFLLGWAFTLAFLGRRIGIQRLHAWSSKWGFNLDRRKIRERVLSGFLGPIPTMGLQREYQTALLTFGALNGLLLLINLLDIQSVWLFSGERTAAELSQFVHTGTWSLIASIVLAMIVVLIFLRGNLNFFPNNLRLRQLVYVWLAQNAFLALSVAVRNAHYIGQYDLAHGRIVVGFFLLAVSFGLYSMYQKVAQRKTAFYLLQVNAIAVGLLLLMASSLNWDGLITRYNLHFGNNDNHYLMYQLQNNLETLVEVAATEQSDYITFNKIQYRCRRMDKRYQRMDWRSWNWSTYRQYRAIAPYREQWEE